MGLSFPDAGQFYSPDPTRSNLKYFGQTMAPRAGLQNQRSALRPCTGTVAFASLAIGCTIHRPQSLGSQPHSLQEV